MPILINKETGQAFDIADDEVETASRSMGLVPATPDQLDWLKKDQEYRAKPFREKLVETKQAAIEGLMKSGQALKALRPEYTYMPEEGSPLRGAAEAHQAKTERLLSDPGVAERAERHPIAHTLGVDAPALFISPAVGGLGGMALESVGVGAIEEVVGSKDEGRDFDIGNAADIATQDLLFSGVAHVVSRVGNLLLFGAGNTTAKNVKRGLEESAGPVVPDDVRFDGPLLEAETRSRRTAAAQSPGMPPGPERDDMLRRAAADLNDQVKTEGGDLIDSTLSTAKASASVADDAVSRRIDETLRETTPAQTAWSADATRKLDEMRTALDSTTDEAAAPFVARAREAADEAIAAIDGSGESASWFRASSTAREQLDSLADDIAGAGLPAQPGIEAAREFLGRSLTDRVLFGGAAEMHAGLNGVARDKIASAVKNAGGDMRTALSEFVSADAATRQTLRRPIEQAIDGFEELASAHERFGTGSPRTIEELRESAAKLRRGLKLADDVQSAQRSAPKRPPRAPAAQQQARRPKQQQWPQQERSRYDQERATAAKAMADAWRGKLDGATRKAGLAAVDYLDTGPGKELFQDLVRDVVKNVATAPLNIATFGIATMPGMPGWFLERAIGRKLGPKASRYVLNYMRRALEKNGPEMAGTALLAASAVSDDSDESNASMASAGGFMFSRRFAKHLADMQTKTGQAMQRGAQAVGEAAQRAATQAGEAVQRGAQAAGEAVKRGALQAAETTKVKALEAGRGVYKASAQATDAFDKALERTAREMGTTVSQVATDIGVAAGQAIRREAEALASPAAMSKFIEDAVRDAIGLSLGPYGRRIARGTGQYLGPKISETLLRWMRKHSDAGKTASETVEQAVEETAEAARKDPDLLVTHTEQAVAAVEDIGAQIRAALNETVEQRAKAMAASPKRLGGNADIQRDLLVSAVDALVTDLGKVSDPGVFSKSGRVHASYKGSPKEAASIDARIAAYGSDPKFIELLQNEAAQTRRTPFGPGMAPLPGKERELWELQRDVLQENEKLFKRVPYKADESTSSVSPAIASASGFAMQAKKAILEARTVQDRFRIGMLLTETLAEHTARAGDGEMAKVFGSYAEKMWQAMSQREIWMGERELQREAKRMAKKRESLLDKLSAGEKIGAAALIGSAALEDEDSEAMGASVAGLGPASVAGLGIMSLLSRRGRRLNETHTVFDQPRPKTIEAIQNVAESKAKNLSEEEFTALRNWMDGGEFGSTATRAAQRSGKPTTTFDAAFDKIAVEEPTQWGPVYRGMTVTDEQAEKLLAADGGLAESVFSTSYDPFNATSFINPKPERPNKVLLRFNKVDRGAPLLVQGMSELWGTSEREMLVPKGAGFKITNRSVEEPDDMLVLDLEPARGPLVDPVTLAALVGVGSIALDDEDAGAAMASAGALAGLGGGLMRKSQLGTIPPKGKAKRPDGPIAAKPERDATPTKFYPNSNQARNEYGEQTRPHREAQQADDRRAASLAKEFGLGAAALAAGGGTLALAGNANAAEPEDKMIAAERIIAIDQAATQRIKHTARVLAGLAEPPSPEGLTTHLARFGAEHEDPRAAFDERKAILAKSEISPALVYDVLGSSLGDVASVSPELYQAATARILDNFRYLRENLPPEVKTSMLHPTGLPVSESSMRDWATQWNTVMDPESVNDDIERGTVTHLQIDTLRNAHADLYQQLRTEIIEEVGANFASIPTSTKMQLDILFQADGLAGPMFSSEAAAIIGAAGKAASQRKQAGPAATGADDQDAAASSNGLEAIRSSVTNRGA